MIKHGADINKANSRGNTTAIYAAANGHTDCLILLVEHGADINKANSCGKTPASLASANGHTDCLNLINSVLLMRAERAELDAILTTKKESTRTRSI